MIRRAHRLNQEHREPEAASASGYPGNIKPHGLRHHYASLVANPGVPYRMAMALMGHSSSSILDLYYHRYDAESAAAMRKISQMEARSLSREPAPSL